MSAKETNRLNQLWSELKRRKVFRVIVMYAATAFILLEVVDIVVPALLLPSWTVTLVIVLLAIGFPIAAILSWVFDITPEGIKKTDAIEDSEEQKFPTATDAKGRFKISDLIIVILIVVVGILAYPKIFNKDRFEGIRDGDGRISVAVMPFQNMSGDTIWDIWQNGIQNELITSLSNSTELSVRTYQTMDDILKSTKHTNYASITPFVASDISRKLEANTFIQGSIKESGDIVRINAQLIDSKTEEIYKTYQLDGNTEDDIFMITDSLSKLVKNYLEIKALEQDIDYEIRKLSNTTSPEAYRFYIQGMKLFTDTKFRPSIEMFNKALEIDSNILAAYTFLIGANLNLGQFEAAKQNLQKFSEKKDHGTYYDQLFLNYWISIFDKEPYACIRYLDLLLENDPKSRLIWYTLGFENKNIRQYEKAIQSFEKAFELSKQWGTVMNWIGQYVLAGKAYHELGNHDRENEIYEMGLSVLPDHPSIIFRQSICALSQDETRKADEYIAKYMSIMEASGHGEDWINYSIGMIYQEAKQYNKAIYIFEDLIVKNRNNPRMKWQLATILIVNEINIDVGMELIRQALELELDNYAFLATKGWGLYKQGQLEESLIILKESWEVRPLYDHDHYMRIQEVEKALANKEK